MQLRDSKEKLLRKDVKRVSEKKIEREKLIHN